jgi:pimeloyl-ACP methyl ester carboxylesterase
MTTPNTKFVLLPGMDGTGDLFASLVQALPPTVEPQAIRYPPTSHASYPQLLPLLRSLLPATEPFVLLAESFSTPVAIQYAADNPPNLKALILCAGFASSPIRGWRRLILSAIAPLLFHLPLPYFLARFFLVGPNPPPPLLPAVRSAIASTPPQILSARLRSILNCDARDDLAKVRLPILYIEATHDRLIAPACVEEIRRIHPHTTVARVAGPHLILQAEPHQSAGVIAKFLSELPPSHSLP